MEGGALFISRNTSVFSWLESVFFDCGFYDVTPISLRKNALAKKLNDVKPRYVFIHSEFYSRATPYMIGYLLLKFPELNIIVVNFGNLFEYNAGHFIFHGAKSYLDINYGVEEFKDGLKKIKTGESYFSPDIERQFKKIDDKPDYKKEINKREWNVLLLICNGHTKEDIMANLEISKKTVDNHIYNLRKLLYAGNWVDMSNKAVCMGWVRKEDLGIKDIKIKEPQFTARRRKRRRKIPVNGGILELNKCLQSS